MTDKSVVYFALYSLQFSPRAFAPLITHGDLFKSLTSYKIGICLPSTCQSEEVGRAFAQGMHMSFLYTPLNVNAFI